MPVLVIECKNANKDEAIALGVDQVRRYHRETPELFVPEQLFTATDSIGFCYGVTGTRYGGTFQLEGPRCRAVGGQGEELLRHPAGARLPEGLHHLCRERRGTE